MNQKQELSYPRSLKSWKDKIDWFQSEHRELDGIVGKPVVFEWEKIPRAHHTAVLTRSAKCDGGQSTTFSWQDLDALVHVENMRLFRNDKNPNRKECSEEMQTLAQCWKSRVTNHLQRSGIDMKIDSVQEDGTQCWIVIRRGVNREQSIWRRIRNLFIAKKWPPVRSNSSQ